MFASGSENFKVSKVMQWILALLHNQGGGGGYDTGMRSSLCALVLQIVFVP